jgi:hypothetical protein
MKVTTTDLTLELNHSNIGYVPILGWVPMFFIIIGVLGITTANFPWPIVLFSALGSISMLMVLNSYRSYRLKLTKNGLSELITRNILGIKNLTQFAIGDIKELHYSEIPYGRLIWGSNKLELHMKDGSWLTVYRSAFFYSTNPAYLKLTPVELFLGVPLVKHSGDRRINEIGSKRLF